MSKIKQTNKYLFYIVLTIFGLLEVVFFSEKNSIAGVVTILEYIICFVVLLLNEKNGIKLFVSFTLLSLGVNNFFENPPMNFWGLRIGSVSFNIVYSLFISLYIVLKNAKKTKIQFAGSPYYKFLGIFFIYSFVIGVFSLGLSINYEDNFGSDVMTYFPFFVYIPLIYQLSYKDCEEIFISTFLTSVFMLWFASFGEKTFQYGNSMYLVQNTIGNLILITSLLIRKKIGNFLFAFCIGTLIYFSAIGSLFISGKMWIVFIVYFLLLSLISKGNGLRKLIIVSGILLVLLQKDFIFDTLISFFEGNTISFKLQQIKLVTDMVSFTYISGTDTSIGNVIGEIKTAVYYYSDNFLRFFFGQGFGAGIPDDLGVLKKWVNMLGYNEHDLPRNNYYKMHLPLTEVFVKGGLFLTIMYLSVFRSVFKALDGNKNIYAIIFFFMYLMFFYVSKESLLYSMILYKLMYNEHQAQSLNLKIKKD